MNIKKDESDKIIRHFGQEFCEKVLNDIKTYSKKWKLNDLQLVNYFSINCIFTCRSEVFGDTILKIGKPCKEVITEFNTLLEYCGRRFCKVYDSDHENGVILEEHIIPGTRLRDEGSPERRFSVFSSLHKGLHIKPEKPDIYPTYTGWVSRITKYMSTREDYRELYLHMKKAEDICLEISARYTRKMLLHGDFHHDNILLDNNGGYKIIDPKGVIGDPVFDIARFILNEEPENVCAAIDFLSDSLNIPREIIKQCYFVETAMANCWHVESNEEPDLERVKIAESMI